LARYNDKNKFCLGVTTVTDNTVEFKKRFLFLYYAVAKGGESFFVRTYVNKEINIMRVELFEYEGKLICKPAEFKFEHKPKSILLDKNKPVIIKIKMGEHYKNEIFNALFTNQFFLKEFTEWIENVQRNLSSNSEIPN
jgi:hypothetical protein